MAMVVFKMLENVEGYLLLCPTVMIGVVVLFSGR